MSLSTPSFPANRGQSEPLDTILLLSIVMVVSISAVVAGTTVLQSTEDQVNTQSAEYALTQFNSEASLVAFDHSVKSRDVTLGLRKQSSVKTTTNGNIKIEIVNGTTNNVETVAMDQSMGSLVYTNENTDDTVAYQAGGVWRLDKYGGASMISPPEFHYNGQTLTFPLVVIDEDQQISGDSVRISKGTSQQLYPAQDHENPVFGDKIRVTITSKYYDAWARFYQHRVPGAVITDRDDANNQIVVELGRPELPGSFHSGAIAATGDITFGGGNAEIDGPATAAGEINCDNCVTGNTSENNDTSVTALDAVIHEKVNEAEEVTSDPTDNSITKIDNEGGYTLTNGTYYVDGDLTLDDQSDAITADLSNGNVTIIVDGDIESIKDGDIHAIDAPNQSTAVRFYSTGDYTLHNAKDYVNAEDGQETGHLQFYGTSEMQIGITGGKTFFEGVIYAPRESPLNEQNDAAYTSSAEQKCDTSDVCIVTGSSDVHGSITAGDMYLSQATEITYDSSLENIGPQLPTGVTPPKLTYLHIGTRHINVTASR